MKWAFNWLGPDDATDFTRIARLVHDRRVHLHDLLAEKDGKSAYPKPAGSDVASHALQLLASTDLFVEKAQDTLSRRAFRNSILAFLLTTGLALLLAFAYWEAKHHGLADVAKLAGWRKDEPAINYLSRANVVVSTLLIIQNLGLVGVLGGRAYFIGALARSFFHEAAVLKNRRHALRLGRLYVYLQLVGVKTMPELQRARESLTPEVLQQAFGWNTDYQSSFKSVRPELVMRGVVSQVAEAAAKVAEAAAQSAKATARP